MNCWEYIVCWSNVDHNHIFKCDCDPHLTNRQSIGHIPDNEPQVQSNEIPADDTVKIEQADDELPAVKYM